MWRPPAFKMGSVGIEFVISFQILKQMIMMKHFLIAAGISMCTFNLNAQSRTTATPGKEGNLIIKGGVNIANISTTPNGRVDDANSLKSFNIGIARDMPLGE